MIGFLLLGLVQVALTAPRPCSRHGHNPRRRRSSSLFSSLLFSSLLFSSVFRCFRKRERSSAFPSVRLSQERKKKKEEREERERSEREEREAREREKKRR